MMLWHHWQIAVSKLVLLVFDKLQGAVPVQSNASQNLCLENSRKIQSLDKFCPVLVDFPSCRNIQTATELAIETANAEQHTQLSCVDVEDGSKYEISESMLGPWRCDCQDVDVDVIAVMF